MNRRLGLVSLFVVAFSVHAQTPEEMFRRANEDYREGRYQKAAERYDSIAASGVVSPAVYFNLGNSYYRMGRIPEAVLAYERARRLDPSDDDIAFNLKLAQLRTADRIDAVPEFFLVSWIRAVAVAVSFETAAALFVFGWSLLFLSLAALHLLVAGSWGGILRWLTLASILAVICSGFVLALQLSRFGEEEKAVIMAPVVTVKTSPDAQSLDAFVVHAGLTVRVEDVVGEWTKIALADGKIGWVRTATFERV